MALLLCSWISGLVVVCYWVYGATVNGSDLNEEQIARRIRNFA